MLLSRSFSAHMATRKERCFEFFAASFCQSKSCCSGRERTLVKTCHVRTVWHPFPIHMSQKSNLNMLRADAMELAFEVWSVPFLPQFRKLAQLEEVDSGTVVDVIGVVDSVDAWQLITKRDGTDVHKRSINVRDDSGRSIEVTLWDRYDGAPCEST